MLNRRQLMAGGVMLAALPRRALAQAPLTIVATTGMIADAALVIGGDQVAVQGLMGPGVDPHGYRQTRSDIVALARADLVLWHGLYLEAQLEALLLDMAGRTTVVAVADALPREMLISHAQYADKFDPHVWMDPTLWSEVCATVGEAIATAHPDGVSARLTAYQAELAGLQDYSLEALASVPPEARVLVTAHDAFNYFGRAYGFDVVGIQGISTDSEAGLARIAELVDLLVERGIKAVFVESSVSDRNMRALQEGAAAKGHEVAIGGTLFSDAMGAPGSYEGTYLGMIDHNVTTVVRALGGVVPDAGWQGKLGQG
ncbi:MAG: metal ABC transporter solute-binding protein, Zn/Mn family [Paracoccaceae bacterium]